VSGVDELVQLREVVAFAVPQEAVPQEAVPD
jgi:hypothetical protein